LWRFFGYAFCPPKKGRWDVASKIYPKQGFPTQFSHDDEKAEPGYYRVTTQNSTTELTAFGRCAFHRHVFSDKSAMLAIDLKHGKEGTCTIDSEDSEEVILDAGIRVVDSVTVQGWRISSGWAKEQYVCFYAKFSQPIRKKYLFSNGKLSDNYEEEQGANIQSIFQFDLDDSKELKVKVGISAVDCNGAKRNLESEMDNWDFERQKKHLKKLWNNEISKNDVKTTDIKKNGFFTVLSPMYYFILCCILILMVATAVPTTKSIWQKDLTIMEE